MEKFQLFTVPCETSSSALSIADQLLAKALGQRKRIGHDGKLCSRCLKNPPANPKDRYCSPCRAAYNRDRRKVLRDERAARQTQTVDSSS